MGWDKVTEEALGLISETFRFVPKVWERKDQKEYQKFLDDIAELRGRVDEKKDDRLLAYKHSKFANFLRVRKIKTRDTELEE